MVHGAVQHNNNKIMSKNLPATGAANNGDPPSNGVKNICAPIPHAAEIKCPKITFFG